MKLRRPRLAVIASVAIAAANAGAYYGWTLRCACHGCHCGLGCRCPKYWVPTLTEMLTVATIFTLTIVIGWRALRRSHVNGSPATS
jgi:hypothetical protein